MLRNIKIILKLIINTRTYTYIWNEQKDRKWSKFEENGLDKGCLAWLGEVVIVERKQFQDDVLSLDAQQQNGGVQCFLLIKYLLQIPTYL